MSNKWSAVLAAILVTATGCGLGQELILKSEAAIESVGKIEEKLKRRQGSYGTALSSTHPALQFAAKREGLSSSFDNAQEKLKNAQAAAQGLQALITEDAYGKRQAATSLIASIETHVEKIETLSQVPGDRLQSWIKQVKQSATDLAAAEKTLAETDALISSNLGEGGKLATLIAAQSAQYPNKKEDLQKRVVAIMTDQRQMYSSIESCRTQCGAITDPQGNFDVVVLGNSLDKVDDLAEGIDLQIDDLADRLGQLKETYELRVTALKMTPTFQMYYEVYDSRYDWDKVRASGWITVAESTYFNTSIPGDGWYVGHMLNGDSRLEEKVEQASGYARDEEWILDKDIKFKYQATTIETVNGVAAATKTASVDEDTFYGYWEAAKKLDDMQGKGSVIAKYEPSRRMVGGEPVAFTMALNMVVEQKLAGQYEDETSESPSVAGGPPLGAVGNEEYGRWENHSGRRRWRFHDYLLLHWALSPTRHHHYYYSDWNGYNSWRGRQGYDSHRYNSSGRRRARSYGASTLRGAGYRSRGRGVRGGK